MYDLGEHMHHNVTPLMAYLEARERARVANERAPWPRRRRRAR